ncbi:MAG TPA: Dam family site-specific DNA-(adenine-N6)-methyltransferase [Caldilineaceae bacterium]|nr:Dam family site-specific DNA-(adenine-N6)-methyltransferase [Caldilineaceae bacterium]
MRTFLKWAGNKQRMVERITRLLPPGQRLIEPFVGSGALFLNTDYPAYLLADSNADLIDLYRRLQTEGGEFIDFCRALFVAENNTPDAFYGLRESFNQTTDSRLKSALFLYLNRHGYNGLCRYNASGGFNVPFGRYKKPYFPQKEMEVFWQKSGAARFCQADFATTIQAAQPGDVVYCDPPYVPLSSTAHFTSYSAGGFGFAQQLALAAAAREAAARGVPVLISNHATPEIEEAYAGATFERFQVQRYISADGNNRGAVGELLALFTA